METRPLIYLRADGNSQIASGHLMRCLTIARSLQEKNALPVFLLSDPESVSLLVQMQTPRERQEHRFPAICMETDYRNPEAELETLQKLLASRPASCLLADSYFATPAYLAALRPLCPVAYLDDLQAFDPPADLIINYDLTVNAAFYQNAGKVLAGAAYTPLRAQFSRQPYRVWEQVRDVFLSTGGTDPFFLAGGLLRTLLPLPRWKDTAFHVITGPLAVHRAELESLAQSDGRVRLYEGVQEMAALMAECDLALSAGGTTLYELCSVGVPSLSFTMADNQHPGVKAFADAGLIPTLGDIRNHPAFYEMAAGQLSRLADDPAKRKRQSARMRAAIDGAGADRIAAALLELSR